MSDEEEPKQKAIYYHIWIDGQEIASFERPIGFAIVGDSGGPELVIIPEGARVIPIDGQAYPWTSLESGGEA